MRRVKDPLKGVRSPFSRRIRKPSKKGVLGIRLQSPVNFRAIRARLK